MKDGLRVWLRGHHSTALWLSALLLAVGSSLLTVAIAFAVPLMAAAVAVGVVGERLRDADNRNRAELQGKVSDLERRLWECNRSLQNVLDGSVNAVENWLEAIGVWAKLDSESRLSFYELGDVGWQRRGRFSTNLLYMNSGRMLLPLGQGAVHQAHLTGEYVLDNLPSFDDDSSAYYAEQKRLGITKAVCKEFTMRSRSYACFAFGRDGDRSRPFALVFESTDSMGLDSDALRSMVHSEVKRAMVGLAELSHQSRQSLPSELGARAASVADVSTTTGHDD